MDGALSMTTLRLQRTDPHENADTWSESVKTEHIARLFVEAINRHDPKAIADLMTEDHRFIDSLGTVVCGRDRMRQGWTEYLAMVPDYVVTVSDAFTSGDTAVLLGKASGTYTSEGTLRSDNYWETPAAWRAVIRGDKVAEWQVYADNEPIREVMRRSTPQKGL